MDKDGGTSAEDLYYILRSKMVALFEKLEAAEYTPPPLHDVLKTETELCVLGHMCIDFCRAILIWSMGS